MRQNLNWWEATGKGRGKQNCKMLLWVFASHRPTQRTKNVNRSEGLHFGFRLFQPNTKTIRMTIFKNRPNQLNRKDSVKRKRTHNRQRRKKQSSFLSWSASLHFADQDKKSILFFCLLVGFFPFPVIGGKLVFPLKMEFFYCF